MAEGRGVNAWSRQGRLSHGRHLSIDPRPSHYCGFWIICPGCDSPRPEVCPRVDHVCHGFPLLRLHVEALDAAQDAVVPVVFGEAADAEDVRSGREPDAGVIPAFLSVARASTGTSTHERFRRFGRCERGKKLVWQRDGGRERARARERYAGCKKTTLWHLRMVRCTLSSRRRGHSPPATPPEKQRGQLTSKYRYSRFSSAPWWRSSADRRPRCLRPQPSSDQRSPGPSLQRGTSWFRLRWPPQSGPRNSALLG